jgi:uncharacterized protein (TIGR02246 family)
MNIKMENLAVVLFLSIFASLLVVPQQRVWAQQAAVNRTAEPSEADDAGVQAFLTDWITAWNAHDADAIMRLHSDDCTTVNRVGLLFLDKNSLTPFMKLLQLHRASDAPVAPIRVLHQRYLTPDLVVLQAVWNIPSMPPPAAQSNGLQLITFLLKRSGTSWLAEEVDTHDVVRPPPGKCQPSDHCPPLITK